MVAVQRTPTRGADWWVAKLRSDTRTLARALPRVTKLAAGTTVLPGALKRARNDRGVGIGTARSGGMQAIYDNPAIVSKDIHNDPYEAHGATGTQIIAGIIRDVEYNPDLEDEKGLWIYRQMWMSDGEVAALLQVLMLPLLEAQWSVEEASKDSQDQEIAQFVQDNLFGGMQRTWEETLQFILLSMFRDGFAVTEKVYEQSDDGMIRLRKLAPRISRSIYRWYPGPDDELDRLQQRVWKTSDDGISGTYIYPVIEAEKLAIFTNMQEGNNFKGISVLRPAYKHWFYKDQLEKIAAVAADRMAIGTPVLKEPPGMVVQQSDRTASAAALSSLHANEKAYFLLPSGYEFDFVTPKAGMNLLPYIEYHSLQIVRSVLAQFLNLDKGGSYALSMDISSFFLQALHAWARYIRDIFNRDVIRPLVDLNFPGVERYPTLDVKNLDRRGLDGTALRGIAMMLPWFTHDANLENAIRQLLDLPDLPPGATPSGGGEPTVDTDSMGEGAMEPALSPAVADDARSTKGGVEVPEGDEPPSEAQLARRGSLDMATGAERRAAVADALRLVLAEPAPAGTDPAQWRTLVREEALALMGGRNGRR